MPAHCVRRLDSQDRQHHAHERVKEDRENVAHVRKERVGVDNPGGVGLYGVLGVNWAQLIDS
jgi:hypothetical protein